MCFELFVRDGMYAYGLTNTGADKQNDPNIFFNLFDFYGVTYRYWDMDPDMDKWNNVLSWQHFLQGRQPAQMECKISAKISHYF